jgi:uncharacterized protein YbjT (DUF2867 family)
MKVTVVGGTGLVGSEVVRELLVRHASVRVLTRGAEEAKKRIPRGVEAMKGDLLDPRTVATAFRDTDAVFLVNAVSPTECHEALMALNGIVDAGVRRLVYLSVHNVSRAPLVPHFASKLAVEAAISASGIAHTILRPNNFFQNDAWSKEALLKYGKYNQPIGEIGLSRVDVRDIAEAAAVSLFDTSGQTDAFDLVGPNILTGSSTARIWSDVLRRPIAYAGNDLSRWEREQGAYLPPWMTFDFSRMYAFFQRDGLIASDVAVARLTSLLGHGPRSFAAFAEETAAGWETSI